MSVASVWSVICLALVAFVMPPRSLGAQQPVVVSASADARDVKVTAVFDRPVTIQLSRVPVKRAVDALAAAAGVRIQYRNPVLENVTTPITLHVVRVPLGTALMSALAGTGLEAVALDRDFIAIRGMTSLPRLEGSVTGQVTDVKTKLPLRGATIIVDDGTYGVQTGQTGTFRLAELSAGPHRIIVRMLGYVRQLVTVTVTDGQVSTLNVALEPSMNALDRIVVTGTIVATAQRAVPNAMTVITAKEIQERGITRIDQLFRGDVPGLFAQNNGSAGNQGSGNPFDQVTMFSRGTTSLSAGDLFTNPIKTYVDGVELANSSYLSQIDPRGIERIEIVSGSQAATIYGSNAINGVMQIFTKRSAVPRPQLTMTLLSGFVQNNFSTALTPQHDHAGQLTGMSGPLSYSIGGSWQYTGWWTPSNQPTRTNMYGGTRTTYGALTVDVSVRQSIAQSRSKGATASQFYETRGSTGVVPPSRITETHTASQTAQLVGRTAGLTMMYSPTAWWSHELVLGTDANTTQSVTTLPAISSPSDTLESYRASDVSRVTQQYRTTAHVPITRRADGTLSVGVDHWRLVSQSSGGNGTSLFRSLGNAFVQRVKPDHNLGAFAQGQFGLGEALYVTYGVRAEWNPNYGADAIPNIVSRYGVAYTRDLASVTAKLRASYGRSTRPPTGTQRLAAPPSDFGFPASWLAQYPPFMLFLANPQLGPESQQGGEGGIELYFGRRASLVVTRYNQTVNDLILGVKADSVHSLVPDPILYDVLDANGYGYVGQYENLNIGNIRNQGWEVQGTMNVGLFSAKGTYSWTKSRTIGVNPIYQSQFMVDQFQKGYTFSYLPEHTWALGLTYAHVGTTVVFNVNGTGLLYRNWDPLKLAMQLARLTAEQPRMSTPSSYRAIGSGYALAEVNATHRLSRVAEGVLQVQNLGDHYRNDLGDLWATMGRQTKMGVRIHY